MDIRLREDEDTPIIFIFSHPEEGVIYINPLASWSEKMRIAPVYDRHKAVSISIEEFMTKALGWEALMSAVFRSQGRRVSISLDNACGISQGFHDMFLDIHHPRSEKDGL